MMDKKYAIPLAILAGAATGYAITGCSGDGPLAVTAPTLEQGLDATTILRRHERTLGVLEGFVEQYNGKLPDSLVGEEVYAALRNAVLRNQLSPEESKAARTNLESVSGPTLSLAELERHMELTRYIISHLREIV